MLTGPTGTSDAREATRGRLNNAREATGRRPEQRAGSNTPGGGRMARPRRHEDDGAGG